MWTRVAPSFSIALSKELIQLSCSEELDRNSSLGRKVCNPFRKALHTFLAPSFCNTEGATDNSVVSVQDESPVTNDTALGKTTRMCSKMDQNDSKSEESSGSSPPWFRILSESPREMQLAATSGSITLLSPIDACMDESQRLVTRTPLPDLKSAEILSWTTFSSEMLTVCDQIDR